MGTHLKRHQTKENMELLFEEAKSVFYDDFAIQFFDDENSEQEGQISYTRFAVTNQGHYLSATVKKTQVISFESYPHVKQQQKSGSSIKVKRNEKRI